QPAPEPPPRGGLIAFAPLALQFLASQRDRDTLSVVDRSGTRGDRRSKHAIRVRVERNPALLRGLPPKCLKDDHATEGRAVDLVGIAPRAAEAGVGRPETRALRRHRTAR